MISQPDNTCCPVMVKCCCNISGKSQTDKATATHVYRGIVKLKAITLEGAGMTFCVW